MGRPLKGESVRDKVVSVRMSEDEAKLLQSVFGGKPAVGMRALFDAWKAQHAQPK